MSCEFCEKKSDSEMPCCQWKYPLNSLTGKRLENIRKQYASYHIPYFYGDPLDKYKIILRTKQRT